nr:SDR family NAD(P)-dependent oxidoreductase [uncultured Lichenicoccus sp.]
MTAAVVTGATGGIGRRIALGLAAAGLEVFLVGRDADRLERTRDWIGGRVLRSRDRLVPVQADLSLLAETRAAADTILARAQALALLVNNAGTLSARRQLTREGHELTLAVNHLSPFVLSHALLPALLAQGGGARIVSVGSSTSDRTSIDPADLELAGSWRMTRAYARSKLALLMTQMTLAQHLDPALVTANVVHPGLVATGLVREPGVVGLAWRLMAPFSLNESQGAETPLYAALSPECAALTGAYLKRRRPARPNRRTADAALRAQVWTATEALAAPFLPPTALAAPFLPPTTRRALLPPQD